MKDTHKWSRKKIALVVLNCLLCLAILISSMVIIIDESRIKNGEFGDESQSDVAVDGNNISENKGIVTARLMCAGDNLIHGSIYKQAKNRSSNGTYDFSYTYEGIKEIIALSDLAFLNQETIIDKDNEPSTYPMFNSPAELLDEMINVGFDVFNQATNHTMDKGLSGAKNDLELFKSKNNIMLTGLRETRNELLKPQTVDVKGITFSFLGITEFLNGLRVPSDSDLGLLYLTDSRYTEQAQYDMIKQMIANAKEVSDVVCVSMHWQDENITVPDSSQVAIMDKLLEYGADIVIGTGPHVLQPIEFKENGDGEQALVIWSLGNLVSCQKQRNNLLGGIADITVSKDTATGKISITEASLIPTITHYNSNFSNVRIIPLINYNKELASQHGTSSTFTYDYIVNFYNEMFGDRLKIKYK